MGDHQEKLVHFVSVRVNTQTTLGDTYSSVDGDGMWVYFCKVRRDKTRGDMFPGSAIDLGRELAASTF